MHTREPSWTEWVESGAWLDSPEPAIPMLPSLAGEVMTLALDPEASIHRIVRLVSQEQVLATRTLRLANSASCAPLRPITTINEAIVRVGTGAVRNTVLAVCVASRLQSASLYGAVGRQLVDHSLGTAHMAQRIAAAVGCDAEEALVYGLLHDIGKLIIMKLARDHRRFAAPAPTPGEMERLLPARHASIGGQLLREWRLPDPLREPVVHHHRPELSGRYLTEARIAYVANALSHRYGFGCAVATAADFLSDPHVAALGIDDAWLSDCDQNAPQWFEDARSLVA